MKTKEANDIIAEFMGHDYYDSVCKLCGAEDDCPDYRKSLDALIPVWEKLKESGIWINKLGNRLVNHFSLFSEKTIDKYTPFKPFDFYESEGSTLQEAACIATAKAIKELK